MTKRLTGFREKWTYCECKHMEDIVDSFNLTLHRIYVKFEPGNVTIEVICDDESLLNELSKVYNCVKECSTSNGKLFYTTNDELNIAVESPEGKIELRTHYELQTCDVAYDPKQYVGLTHGPKSVGFFKSMIFGIVAEIQQDLGYYGIHAGIAVINNVGRVYAGGLNAGKTTASFNAIYHAMLNGKRGKIITDDWGVIFNDKGKYRAIGIEKYALIREEMIEIFSKLNLKKKFKEKRVKTETQKKAYFHPDEIFGDGTLITEGPIDVLFLLIPRETKENTWKPTQNQAINEIINSSYHIPNVDNRKLEARKKFFGRMYNDLPIIAVSTRNLKPHQTYEEMENVIKSII